MKKKAYLLLTGLVGLSLLTGCGSHKSSNKGGYAAATNDAVSTESSYSYYSDDIYGGYDYAVPEAEELYDASNGSSTTSSTNIKNTNRKLISTVHMNVETKEFEVLLSTIENKVAALGGYIENSSTYNGGYNYSSTRNADMTIRIPSNNLDGFVNDIAATTNVTSKSTSVEDVTLTYVDLESRKNALKIEQENLLEMLDKAETIEDMIYIESRLSDVRYQLESMESQLRTFDDKVDYATIYLDIKEVRELTPVKEMSAGEEISEGFMGSLRDIKEGFTAFGIWFIVNLPKLLLILLFPGIIAIIIVCNVKKAKKRKAKRLAEQAAAKESSAEPAPATEENK